MLVKNIIFLQVLSLAAVLSGCASAPKTAGMVVNKPLEFALVNAPYGIARDAASKRVESIPSFKVEKIKDFSVSGENGFYADDTYSKIMYYSSYQNEANYKACFVVDLLTLEKKFYESQFLEDNCNSKLSKFKKLPVKIKKTEKYDVFYTDETVAKQGITLNAIVSKKQKVESANDRLKKIPIVDLFVLAGELVVSIPKGLAEIASANAELFNEKTNAIATIEMIDDRANLNQQKQDFELLKTSNSLKDFQNYGQKYPKMYLQEEFVAAKTNLAKDFFTFKLVDSYTGSEEDHSMRTLTMSATGKCKKMTKTVEIRPAVNSSKFYNQNFKVAINGTLKRYYKPYGLNAKDDLLSSRHNKLS